MSFVKRRMRWGLAVVPAVCAIVLAIVLFGDFGGGSAGEDGPSLASESDGVDEGIQVHGDWVIEVRNADGSVAERREFENALTSFGSHFLDLTLARTASVGEWLVAGNGSACPSSSCSMSEVGGTHNWGFATSPTLQLSTQQNPNQFVMQGNFDATTNGDINEVATLGCFAIPPTLNAAACNNTSTFTSTTLASPVSVVAGQQVLVTVRISFS